MLRSALAAAVAAALWAGVILPRPRPPSDPDVAALSGRFDAAVAAASGLSVSSYGSLRRDRDTLFWSFFTDKFGANPNTPYMWSALPLVGFLLPSPMWSLGRRDAVVYMDIHYPLRVRGRNESRGRVPVVQQLLFKLGQLVLDRGVVSLLANALDLLLKLGLL